jgi:glycosyltransferase involved in cell wall biosynthesis
MKENLQITPSYKPAYYYGGPTLSVSRLCEALGQTGVAVEVQTTTANGAMELLVTPGETVRVDGVACTYHVRLTGDHTHLSLTLLWACWKAIPKAKVVHIHSWWNLVAIPAVLLCRMRGVRPILSPRGMLSPYTLKSPLKRWFHHSIGRWLLRGTVLHATSDQEAREALALMPDWPYFVLPNIISLPPVGAYRPLDTTSGVFQLIFLSRVHPKKGLDMLFSALAKVDFAWQLHLVGEGTDEYTASLQQLAGQLGLTHRISWLGWRDGAEKFQLLANADLFVLPSQNENFANVVIESLAVGTPVLVSDQVGLSNYVQEQGVGWVAPLTVEAWVNALHHASAAADLRAAIRAKAPQQIREDFGAEALAQQYLDAYQKFCPA